MKILVGLLAGIVTIASLQSAARADSTPGLAKWRQTGDYCKSYAFMYQGNWDVNGSAIESGYIPDAFKAAVKDLKDDAPFISTCAPGRDRDYVFAYVAGLEAVVMHRVNDPRWRTELNLSDQLLEKCITAFYGTEKGAQCQTDLETNIHRKLSWHDDDYAGAPIATPRPKPLTMKQILAPMPVATIAPPPQ